MLHPPRLIAAEAKDAKGAGLPAILHNAYRAPDGSEAVVLVNATDRPQQGVLEWDGRKVPVALGGWQAKLIKKE